MSDNLILLHTEALRMTHPVFQAVPVDTRAIFIWDDVFLQASGYSLKRLVFIFETLRDMPVDIIKGDTLSIVKILAPAYLSMPASNNPNIISLVQELSKFTDVKIIEDEEFAVIKKDMRLRRFFQYWNKVEKSVMQKNGGNVA